MAEIGQTVDDRDGAVAREVLEGLKMCYIGDGNNMANSLIVGGLKTGMKAVSYTHPFGEIMACPGGCAGGGGQPIDGTDREKAVWRGNVLYDLDQMCIRDRG